MQRNRALDLNLGLVLGGAGFLVVDTGTSAEHGARFAAGCAERGAHGNPSVVLTHAHFDHVFGTTAFPGAAVYAHPDCAATLSSYPGEDRTPWAELLAIEGFPALAEELRTAPLVHPTRHVTAATVDLGDRRVHLTHPGRGHTGGDLIVHIPDVATVFAGDLVEQGAPPQAGDDAFPAEWPATLDRILALRPHVVVPGHGEPVDARFVAAQRDQLAG